MKVTLLKDFEAKTTAGPRLLPAGKELDLPEEKATALISAGIAEPADLPRPYVNNHGVLVIPHNAPARYRWWNGGQPPSETLHEIWLERAAIFEYSDGLPRADAERLASERCNYWPPKKNNGTAAPLDERIEEND